MLHRRGLIGAVLSFVGGLFATKAAKAVNVPVQAPVMCGCPKHTRPETEEEIRQRKLNESSKYQFITSGGNGRQISMTVVDPVTHEERTYCMMCMFETLEKLGLQRITLPDGQFASLKVATFDSMAKTFRAQAKEPEAFTLPFAKLPDKHIVGEAYPVDFSTTREL